MKTHKSYIPLADGSEERGNADCPRKRKHDQKASNDIADWKWEKKRVTTRRVATT